MSFFDSPVARRTRHQWDLYYLSLCGTSSRNRTRKRNRETGVPQSGSTKQVIDVDECLDENKDSKTGGDQYESEGFCRSTRIKVDEVKKADESLLDELEEEKDHINETAHLSMEKSVGVKESNYIDVSSDSSDNSDLDETYVPEEQEDADKDQRLRKYHHWSTNNTKACPFQSTEDDLLRSRESDDESPTTMKQSPMDINPIYISSDTNESEKEGSDAEDDSDSDGLVERKEKNRSSTKDDDDEPLSSSGSESNKKQPTTKNQNKSGKDSNRLSQKSSMKKVNQKSFSSSGSESNKKQPTTKNQNKRLESFVTKIVCHKNLADDDDEPLSSSGSESNKKQPTTKNQNKSGKDSNRLSQKSSMKKVNQKPMTKSRGSINDILDSIIRKEDGLGKKGSDRLPLKFRFEDSEDESTSQKTDEFNAKDLFEEMDLLLNYEEMGSYRTPTVNNQEKDDHDDNGNVCERGEHGDIYLEEQTGLRCRLCGAVLLESRYVISKLANYAPDKSKRSYHFDEQRWSSSGNPYPEASDCNSPDIMGNQTGGTVWELIPTSIRYHLYPHQQQAFKFLWENLAGTIELSELQKLGPRGGGGSGGCIISHAPGTGKTLLTIVFVETFLKRFPRCCPVIVAPASMLLTWEAEFKKWQVGFSFINLNSSEFLRKERINVSSRHNKDFIRAIKVSSWSKGGSVLGISYNLYTKLAGNSNTKNESLEKMRNVLLDMPGLVVLDEGHTPRNKKSNIWNTLLKLKTNNRVILSGTPFQNNFGELFNTLRLVRPETATNIVNEKIFADMIQQNMKRSKNRSTYEDVKKLKKIISPFVHVHKGHILESKLPGLKQTVILLDPPPIQKSFIENLGNMTTTFEYEHKVALVSVHPSLILHCSLSEKEEKSVNQQELEKMRLQPDYGVKTRFVMELVRLCSSLHEKVLIFSQYVKPFELLQDQLAKAFGWDVGMEMMVIKGRTNQMLRQTIINDFNDPNGKVKVLLASTRCCSEGIHLYGASRVVLLDVVWNPSVERQAISRAYRLGQKKVVYTYHLMAAGTTEENKYDRQVEKARLAEMVFSSASMASVEADKKVNVDDKMLQHMLEHQKLKQMFKKIKYLENQTRV